MRNGQAPRRDASANSAAGIMTAVEPVAPAIEQPEAHVIPSEDIERLLARREDARRRIEAIAEHIKALGEMRHDETAPVKMPSIEFANTRRNFDAETCMKLVDADLWNHLIHGTGLWDFMDGKARDEWRKSYDKQTFPELTEENIESALEALHRDRGKMLARGVADCFRLLSSHHKTNKAERFGMKIIREYLDSYYSHGKDSVDDLNRFVHKLRGLPEPTRDTCAYVQFAKAKKGDGPPWVAVFPFFKVRIFKNGNGHILFDHQADVDRLNACLSIATGGNRLPTERKHR